MTFEFNRLWKDLKQSGVKKRTKNNPTLSPICWLSLFLGILDMVLSANTFLMYISIKRHSWFFKSLWCLLYFGHVRTRTAGKKLTTVDAILFKIVLKCANECLILKYNYIQNPWQYPFVICACFWDLKQCMHIQCLVQNLDPNWAIFTEWYQSAKYKFPTLPQCNC